LVIIVSYPSFLGVHSSFFRLILGLGHNEKKISPSPPSSSSAYTPSSPSYSGEKDDDDDTDDYDKDSKAELIKFTEAIQSLPTDEIERDIAEIENDVSFLEAQIRIDARSYTQTDLKHAKSKINLTRRKAELLKREYRSRSNRNSSEPS
jgi:hypothetical protein